MTAAPERRRLRLGRGQKLHGSREFVRAKLEGDRRVCGCLIVNWRRPAQGEAGGLGIVTSRKVGGSVVRSRARRLMREAFRLQQHQVESPLVLVLVARPSLAGKPLEVVCRDLRRCLREAGLWTEAVGAPAEAVGAPNGAGGQGGRVAPGPSVSA